ncbi:hypothetical protein DFJ73DRAFT_765450 [Zopfochytrium polystomum]|nr:hypothetical protein DFJ73DRAFT_765450 [Zopfochytrium polystomum]
MRTASIFAAALSVIVCTVSTMTVSAAPVAVPARAPAAVNDSFVRRDVPASVDHSFTPGKLCTPDDPSYQGEAYGISKCTRSVSTAEKNRIAAHYGLLKSEYSLVEFDHLIPLGIGGSNDITNLWPQQGPTGQSLAGEKDKVELDAYNQLSSGQISQRDAVQMICDWMNNQYGTNYDPSDYGL